MQFKTDMYPCYLSDISGIKFTMREIDIICCLLYKRSTKKVASLLCISPRTVEAHIHNIMNKIGCSSKDDIIDFVEKSGAAQRVYQYYRSLLVRTLFRDHLQKIASLNKRRIVCVTNTHDHPLISQVKQDLKLANIILTQEAFKYKNIKPINIALEGLSAQNYYSFVFDIIKDATNKPEISDIVKNFQKESDTLTVRNNMEEPVKERFYRSYKFLPAFFVLLGFIFVYIFYGNFYIKAEHRVRSDLIIPHKKVLLERHDIVQKMDKMLAEKTGIKTITLAGIFGIGGAGKTTLARYYGSFVSDAKVVWELNAERIESLMLSFQNLAYALAQDDSARKKELDAVTSVQNVEKKHKQLLSLIKAWLKECNNWLLIYDNVENIMDIKDYLPQDPTIWGHGNVIITTRNANIKNTEYLTCSHVIQIEELSQDQKLTLFSKIYHNKVPDKLTLDERQKTESFLTHIPPFPLDVSCAAYYLQSTNTSFEQYLQNLQNPHMAFEHVQESLLKEKGHYTKTRYGIITMCLQRILDAHPEFTQLALFMSLLDSQNIPKALLESPQNVDAFIINLKKYSLITSESSNALGQTFSLHRSTQAIMLAYLTQTLCLNTDKEPLLKISHSLENHMNKLINEENYAKLVLLSDHCETFLAHSNLLTQKIIGSMGTTLGEAYCYLARHTQKTKQLLETSLKNLEQHDTDKVALNLICLGVTTRYLGDIGKGKDLLEKGIEIYKKIQVRPEKLAQSLSYLGEIHRVLGNYQKAMDLLEQSMAIYKSIKSDHIEVARVMSYLGEVYHDFGQYKKAKDLFEKSINIYKTKPKAINLGFSLTELGKVYNDLGDYKKSISLSEQALNIYKDYGDEKSSGIGWTKTYLAIARYNLGEYRKAQALLEDALKIYQKHFGKDHANTAWISVNLANVYIGLGDYKKAQTLMEYSFVTHKRDWHLLNLGKMYSAFGEYIKAKGYIEKGLAGYIKHYGADHIQTAKALNALAEACLLKSNMFEEAEKALNKAKTIFQRESHPDLMFTYELLGDLYAKKSEKAKSTDYYKQALTIGQTFLKKDSAHIIRLNKKLSLIK